MARSERKRAPRQEPLANGRPEFEVTEERQRFVQMMAACGVKQDEMCLVLGLSPPTLRKHFFHELDTGAVLANVRVAQSLYARATAGEGKDSVTAQIFWLKCRANWDDGTRNVDRPGKKEQADMLARDAERGTGWDGLLN